MPGCGEPGLYLFNSRVNPSPFEDPSLLSPLPLPLSLHLISSGLHVCRDGTKSQAVGR